MPSSERVAQLFEDALEQPEAERAHFLAAECGGDAALLAEVQALLTSDEDAGSAAFWKGSAIEVEAVNFARETDPRLGQTIGRYRILEAISSGGMGTVYKAVRDDAAFEKYAAIKVIKRGMDTDFIVQRFRNERQILANLEHPNIARLLDGGATEDGLPYLVMEYVEGQPIDQYAEERGLTIPERLRLFRTVCAAVQYAHQNLVVHRDLKPSNILVTREGDPKLLDFGIAKLVSPEGSRAEQTVTMMRFLTPEYASPEQIRGEPITTVSDIYSLGVLLYRLLTGQRPYRPKGENPDELARAICTETAERPSTAVTRGGAELVTPEMAKARKRLSGDLDNIVLMAMRKEPERRYASVEQFSEDIRRDLEGLPVIAHRDTFGYRTAKFVRRHRMGVAAAALIGVSLVAGIVGIAWEAHVAQLQRARAEKRFADVRKIANTFLFEIHDSIENVPGTLAARQLILKRALEYLDDLEREAGDNLGLKSELADAYEKVGTFTWDVNARLEIHRKELALTESMVKAEPSNKKYREQLAESYISVGDSLKDRNDLKGAAESYLQAKTVMERLQADDPENMEYQQRVVDAAERIGITRGRMGQIDQALASHFQSQKLLEGLLARDAVNIDHRRGLMNNRLFIERLQVEKGDYRAALENCRIARETAEALYASDPRNTMYQRDLWISDSRIGVVLLKQGNAEGALDRFEKALARIERLSSADPGDKGHRRGMAVNYMNAGEALVALDWLGEAQRYYDKAIATSMALLAADPEKGETRVDLAVMHTRLGTLFLKKRDWARASGSLNKARNFYEASSKIDPNDAAAARGRAELYALIGELDARVNRPAEARQFYQRSLDILVAQRASNSLAAADAGKPAEIEQALAKLQAERVSSR